MSHPRAFISFDFDNNSTEKLLFVGQSRSSRTPFNIQDWSSKTHLPQREWEYLVGQKIKMCDLMIVLVGPKTYLATGVEKEIVLAKENGVPIFGVYVGGANMYTPLPNGIARNRVTTWTWENVASWIDSLT